MAGAIIGRRRLPSFATPACQTLLVLPAIRIDSLGKQYWLGAATPGGYRTLREEVMRQAARPWQWLRGERRPGAEPFWALRDLTLEVQRGEVVGIVGRNGAGKSTLLKILSRITEPTTGRVEVAGRVGSLLEVGAGFHPELTGRENVFLNGAILGMSRREMHAKFDQIVAFAEVSQFIDTPVKRYSSGMYVRLAFAIAAHLDLDTLLVDEVLAVGDAAFQKKCLGRMSETVQSGRTVLFVSHNMSALAGLCKRAVWLERGTCAADGPVGDVVAAYLQSALAPETERSWESPEQAPGNDKVRLRRASIRRADSAPGPLTVRTPLVLAFEYWNLEADAKLHVTLHLIDSQGAVVFSSASFVAVDWQGRPYPIGLFRSECEVPGDLLNDGHYSLKLFFVKDGGTVLAVLDELLSFAVQDDPTLRGDWYGQWPGVVRPLLAWKTAQIANEAPSPGP